MFEDFAIWADGLPRVSMVFLCDDRNIHTIFAEAIGMCDDHSIIVENELFAIHTTTS
jgi:hypothetical protein